MFSTTVIRSRRRKKSSQARLDNGGLEIRIPAWFSEQQELDTVAYFTKKFRQKTAASEIDLVALAKCLADTHGYRQAQSIRWVANQQHRWGSCTPGDGAIRISNRLVGFPTWVLEYIVCHELAHLDESNHGRAFWELANRYPLAERARGFLLAKGVGDTKTPTPEERLSS